MRMRLVVLEREIPMAEGEDVLHFGIYAHRGQRKGLARKLLARLVEMVEIEMRVAEGVHELAGREPRHLRHHHRQQRIARDVERDAQEDLGRALVELAREPAVRDIELEQTVAWRQR